MMKNTLLTISLTLAATGAFAQTSEVRRLFESGQYQAVVESASPDGDPGNLYAAAQSHQKLGAIDNAMAAYAALASRGEEDPWHWIGQSGQQILQEDAGGAIASGRQAVELAGGMPEAHYQLALALAKGSQWSEAATEFDRVTELSPENAYGYYYGGLMHYRSNRPDRMANRFEMFLKLAPEAPERPEVMTIMRTVRGR